ncbi:glycosyltransferase family 2 protein [Pseudodesulfovibrio sp. zrk46]|uniref:glycosyltransferase family 2 protein n=1 Tax=Pseudodesulfovibrio sp. zrk46 TaxID=2725288 RepID=UPI00144A17B1|nr:glycosyltransferase family 2 protein [Pseudodesulfovibrio sp. zrk46]QJB56396.1 glycosyltransferase family 2 protein [Pseudodesulfovibrio sp. zrk46]
MTAEFSYIKPGISSELGCLNGEELCQHYMTYMRNYVLDEDLGSAYFNRFASDTTLGKDQALTNCFLHLVRKMQQTVPFNLALRQVMNQIAPSPEGKVTASLLEKFTLRPDLDDMADTLCVQGKAEQAHDLLLNDLNKSPGNVVVASRLAAVDLEFGLDMSWLDGFTVPDVFDKDWNTWLIGQYVHNGQNDSAMELWNATDGRRHEDWESIYTYMGALCLSTGQPDTAKALFDRSLAIDPKQFHAALARQELDNPFTVRDVDLSAGRAAICLYSYNRADLLEMTLRSLCATEIGESDVLVLLNGCSDNSRDMVLKVKEVFPDVRMTLLEQPVNIGAPAARNMLVHHALNELGSEFIAFLDDDVTLPGNWLQGMLTELEDDPSVGAVGCRVLDPGGEDLQYLYRDVAIAKPGVFRLSLGAPFKARDFGLYSVRRDTDCVMGCCHVMRKECFDKVPEFDILFTPTQLDDVSFHLDLRLAGFKVRYIGQIACVHHRATGFKTTNTRSHGNAMGNDVKFYYRFADKLGTLRTWQAERNQGLLTK